MMNKESVTRFQGERREASGRMVGAAGGWLAYLAANVPVYMAIGEKIVAETKAGAR